MQMMKPRGAGGAFCLILPTALTVGFFVLSSQFALGAEPATPRGKTGRPWADMDYGPFLTASIEAPSPATNIAFKGIAIRLADAFGGEQNESVVFDTDLLRYSAGWVGDFVALKGVVFDGEHWAYPQISGEQLFGNPHVPGWARDGSFKDPREFIYGPLPRDWAHWKGLYLQGQKVVLSYTVGGAEVLEMPGLEKAGGLTAFSRTLNIGPSDRDLVLQLAFERDRVGRLVSLDSPTTTANDLSAGRCIALLAPPRRASESGADASVPAPTTINDGLLGRWDFDQTQGATANDQSTNGRPLKLRNTRWGPGHAGQAIELAGNGYGELEGAGELEFLKTDLTFAAWINTRQDGTLFSQTAPEGPWVHDAKALFIQGGRLTFDIGWVGAVTSQRSVANGRWQHVAMTWSRRDGTVAFYVNGVRDGGGTLKPGSPTKGHVFRVGFAAQNFPQTPFFNGRLDEVRLYVWKLNEAEIKALASPGAASDNTVLAASIVGAHEAAKWLATPDGHLRLQIPASAAPARFRVLLGRIAETNLPRFAELVKQAAPPADLAPLTLGGPSRWAETLTTRGKLGSDAGAYAVDSITWPEQNPWNSWMRFGGFDFFQDATRAAICTWSGDVWLVSGLDDKLERLTWRRFATGLFQPLGLKIVNEQIYVLGRDQITRLHDFNSDGEADFYENFNNDAMVTEHFHEFAMDFQTDAAGDFYYMKGARHARDALHPQHGTLMKVSKDGSRTEIIANGFRAPNGLEVTPRGEFYTTDQEGYWMPANRLNRIEPGKHYGNTWSWFPEGKPTNYASPICWIHPRVDRSPSTMAWVTSDRWGPLKDSLLSLSYGVGRIFLVMHETINGVMQGGVTPLPPEFDTGIMRSRFSPRDGQFYTCGLFGWAGNKTLGGGFYRVRCTGKPLRLPSGLHTTPNGVVLQFTDPLDLATATDVSNYSVEAWNYRWTENYGSPDFKLNGEKGRDRLPVESASVSKDGKTVFLKLPGIGPVMQMNIQMNLKAADGTPIQTYVHNTIHALGSRSGEEWLGEQAVAAVRQTQTELKNEASGLLQTLSLKVASENGAADIRRSRLAAIHVPAGSPPTPFLAPGPFVSTWRGFLKLDLSESYAFHAIGRGRAMVKVNGETVVPVGEAVWVAGTNRLLQLKGGLNPIEITYESPVGGDAVFRLFWSNAKLRPEPVPPTAFVHDADDADSRKGETRRLGRDLFATRHCIKCHKPSAPLGGAMPELLADAPFLDHAGSRFNADWLVRWMKQPKTIVPETTMPACLSEIAAEAEAQARDVAAYLATLTGSRSNRVGLAVPSEPSDQERATRRDGDIAPSLALPRSPETIQAGEANFAKLGCVACHILPGETKLEADTRRPLGHVAAKWQPPALVEFLQAPTNSYAWTRMPDFQLKTNEAQSLAAFLLSRSEPIPAAVAGQGDAQRGQELVLLLGCVNCHTITGAQQPGIAGQLEALNGKPWQTGCLAESPAQRRKAPNFGFSPTEVRALRQFVQQDLASLQRDTTSEFATRQFATLRCTACHQRDSEKDLWFALEAREAAKKPKISNGFDDEESQDQTIHRTRPPLTFSGEKLRAEWTEQLLLGKLPYKARPKLEARMPAFPAYARGLAQGLALDHGLAPASSALPAANPELARVGQALIQKGSLGCVDCHAVGAQAALAGADTTTINFAHIPERLRRDYYDRYVLDPQHLLPGTMMPAFANEEGLTGITTHFGGDARKQFDAIWHFMRTVRYSESPAK